MKCPEYFDQKWSIPWEYSLCRSYGEKYRNMWLRADGLGILHLLNPRTIYTGDDLEDEQKMVENAENISNDPVWRDTWSYSLGRSYGGRYRDLWIRAYGLDVLSKLDPKTIWSGNVIEEEERIVTEAENS